MEQESDAGEKVGIRITDELDRKIEREAASRGVDKSVVVSEICHEVLGGRPH